MTARNFSTQRARILDRVERRMLDRRRRDAELAEVGEQVFGGLGHGSLAHGSLEAGSRACKTFSRRIETSVDDVRARNTSRFGHSALSKVVGHNNLDREG